MIERSQDYRRIKRLMVFDMMVSRDICYLIETQDGEDVGIWYLEPWKDGALMHVNMTKACRGRKAIESGKRALQWARENTDFRNIYAMLPLERCGAQMLALWLGFKFLYTEGENRFYGVSHG